MLEPYLEDVTDGALSGDDSAMLASKRRQMLDMALTVILSLFGSYCGFLWAR